MPHDHSKCGRQHHSNYDESPVAQAISTIGTLVFMFENGEADEDRIMNAIIGTIESIDTPWTPIELESFLSELDPKTSQEILELPEIVLHTFRHQLKTNRRASEIAQDLQIEEYEVWLHLDQVHDAIHNH